MSEKRVSVVSQKYELTDAGAFVKIFWLFTFAVLTSIGAQIEVQNHPVPYTMQTLFVLLAGALLGKKSGSLSMLIYVTFGAAGLPVFSGFGSGLTRIIGPTGGYLLSFPVAAFVVGYLVRLRSEFWWIVLSMTAGAVLILGLGTLYLNVFFIHNWQQSFYVGYLIFSWWDGIKILGASMMVYYYFRSVDIQR